jgi:multiple sugar transport system permease protein
MAVVTSSRKKAMNRVAIAAVLVIAIAFLSPLYWIGSTAFKPRSLATTVPPTVFFQPEITPFIKLFTKRVQLTKPVDPAVYDTAPWYEKRIYDGGERILRVGPNIQMSQYPNRFMNSLIVAIISTFIAVSMGTITAYGFSRFKMAGEADWLFFILSTRMLPPIVVAIPMYLMYRVVGLNDSHIGLIILYTAFNLSFSVWLMKGFMDEIPKEYEEAALVDGYTRMQSFFKIVLPEAITGIAATSVFCFITAWNEYAFALIMTNRRAQTAPPFIPSQIGSGLADWTVIAAGTFLFILPVAIFTFMLRNHLLRGVTFGAIRK